MTELAGGIEEYNVDKAAEDIRTAHRIDKRETNTPQPMLNGKEPFDSAALWERHGQPASANYFGEWQETRQALRSEFDDVWPRL